MSKTIISVELALKPILCLPIAQFENIFKSQWNPKKEPINFTRTKPEN